MSTVRLLLVLALALVPPASAGGALLFPDAVTVKAYMFESDHGRGVFQDFATLDATAVPGAGVPLSPAQVARLKLAFAEPSGEQGAAACFNPRHGFVFYDAKGTVVGTLDICFECTNTSVNSPGYDAKAKPVYERFKQPDDSWDEKLHRKQMAAVDRVRATFGMPSVNAPVDWKRLEMLVRELGMPPEPKPADYERLRVSAQ
jgi:hypothetical protein